MAEYNKYIGDYERIPYKSFVWKFGTTSFRTREFNKMTEWQLKLLDEFWEMPENHDQGWEKKFMAPGQQDIYEIKNRYYDWLVKNKFTKGDDSVKYKAAREKTSGLYDMGLINENHRLTEVGRKLLAISKNSNSFKIKNDLNISEDSQIYLEQLIKLSYNDVDGIVRPFIVILYLLSELNYLSYDEFRYLMPLCTSLGDTSYILNSIKSYRNDDLNLDQIIIDVLLSKENYQDGLCRFVNNPFSGDLLLSVGMNRKSANYDKSYIAVYKEMHSVYIQNDPSRIFPLFQAISKLSTSIKWKTLMFNTSLTSTVKKDPEGCLLPLPDYAVKSEEDFKRFFYITMHLNKAKSMLEDYFDLNRRYLGLTNCFIFDDAQVKLDIVPKQFFKLAIKELYKQAYEECVLLFECCDMESICPALKFNASNIIKGINEELGTNIESIEEAYNEVDKIRYQRFNKLIDDKFTNDKLLILLKDFDDRNDDEIGKLVTDNADIPTIFEYVLGIIWYKASERKGKILDYLKLSLDANLLPVTHAAGGEADIVYEYKQTLNYPAHSLLLEATLADSTNQRRMEMEPVSRHLGKHLLRTRNKNSYCVFATTYLNMNVISDFRLRKYGIFYEDNNHDVYISGMKIMPLCTNDLRCIIKFNITYTQLFKHFSIAYECNEMEAHKWYKDYVSIENSNLVAKHPSYIKDDIISIAAEPKGYEYYKCNKTELPVANLQEPDTTILIGCYKNKQHLNWIIKNGIYNIRLGNRQGSVVADDPCIKNASILLLYNIANPKEFDTYNIISHRVLSREEMEILKYPKEHIGKEYMTFKINENLVLFKDLKDTNLIPDVLKSYPGHIKGKPIFIESTDDCMKDSQVD